MQGCNHLTMGKCMNVLGERLRLAPLDLPFPHHMAVEVSSARPFFICQERSQLLLRDVVQKHVAPLCFSIAHHLLACILVRIFVSLLYGMRRITAFSDKRNPETPVVSMGECSWEGRYWDQRALPPSGFYVYLCLSRTHIIQFLELRSVLGSTIAGPRTLFLSIAWKIFAPGELSPPQLQVLACLRRGLIGRSTVFCPDVTCGATEEWPVWREAASLHKSTGPLPICSSILGMRPASKGTSDGGVRTQASAGPGMRNNLCSVGLVSGMWHAWDKLWPLAWRGDLYALGASSGQLLSSEACYRVDASAPTWLIWQECVWGLPMSQGLQCQQGEGIWYLYIILISHRYPRIPLFH